MEKVNFRHVIKWSGSKRSQAAEILRYFPDEIDTYYEPFCGGGSMMRALMEQNLLINVKRFAISDINSGLIDLWKAIMEKPAEIADRYEELWSSINSTDDKAKKRSFFNDVRLRYNKNYEPADFMFIIRTTTNGML